MTFWAIGGLIFVAHFLIGVVILFPFLACLGVKSGRCDVCASLRRLGSDEACLIAGLALIWLPLGIIIVARSALESRK